MTDPYLEQVRQNIISLIAKKKFKEAHTLCHEMITKFPEEDEFKELKEKIEEKVEDENNIIVKEKIEELAPLWKSGNYIEILEKLKPLFKISENNKELIDKFSKAQTLYKKQIKKSQEDFYQEQITELKTLLAKDPNKLLEKLSMLERNNPGNKNIIKLAIEFREKVIKQKIKEKKDLLDSNKYEAINNFIETLKKINKKSKEVSLLEEILKDKWGNQKNEEKNEFIYKGEQYLETLMKLEKYEKAIKTAEEILDIDPKNKKTKAYLSEAKKKYFVQSQEKSIDSIEDGLTSLKGNYKKHKDEFVRI